MSNRRIWGASSHVHFPILILLFKETTPLIFPSNWGSLPATAMLPTGHRDSDPPLVGFGGLVTQPGAFHQNGEVVISDVNIC